MMKKKKKHFRGVWSVFPRDSLMPVQQPDRWKLRGRKVCSAKFVAKMLFFFSVFSNDHTLVYSSTRPMQKTGSKKFLKKNNNAL